MTETTKFCKAIILQLKKLSDQKNPKKKKKELQIQVEILGGRVR